MKRFQSTEETFADQWIIKGPRKSFMDKVDEVINWKPIEKLLKRNTKRLKDAIGADPYPILAMFKSILAQRWFGLSDRDLEDALYNDLRLIRFTRFSVSSEKPDHTTICRFRNALLVKDLYKKILAELNRQLEKAGVLVKEGAIIDATLVESSRRPRKYIEEITEDRKEPDEDEGTVYRVRYSEDTEARWVKKANKAHYGYKANVATDAEYGFVLGGHVTGANESDMKQLERILDDQNFDEGTLVACDKGYASKENREFLKARKLKDAIMKKAARNRPLNEDDILFNKRISRFRYKVERCFGTLKRQYGFHRARYLGRLKTELELYLNAFAFNLKKFVLLVS